MELIAGSKELLRERVAERMGECAFCGFRLSVAFRYACIRVGDETEGDPGAPRRVGRC